MKPVRGNIFSNLFVIVRRFKADSFVGGLIFGAIFSLIVNIITIQIQELVQKQRVLEAVENEIAFNARLASRIIEKNTKKIQENTQPSFFDTRPQYVTKVWGTSEALKYIVQLSASVQADLGSYYDILLPGHNSILEKYEELSRKYLADCFGATLTLKAQTECLEWNKIILSGEMETAKKVGEESVNILHSFHPTRDRLNNWLLRMILGNTAIGMLSSNN